MDSTDYLVNSASTQDCTGLIPRGLQSDEEVEAYEVLQKLSADERKRLEYEARQKAIRDYDSQMSSSREEGIRIGEDRLNHLYEKLMKDHRSEDLMKAIFDKAYREKLYQEYGL